METTILQDYGRQKLLGYADSFRELADSFQNFRNIPENEETDAAEEENRQLILWDRQIKEQRAVFAGQLQEMSRMISDIAQENYHVERISEKKYRRLIKEMKAEGILINDLFFTRAGDGHRQYSLRMKAIKRTGISVEDTAGFLSVLLDMRLVPHRNSPFFITAEWDTYLFQEEPAYHVLMGEAKAVKQSESVSGDCYEFFEYGEGMTAALLSDGMGTGERALLGSSMVIDLMRRFLEAGFSPEAALQLINGVLLTGEAQQNTSTIDCCNIDLYQGLCYFYKVGAAPSYLKRENLVEQISSRNLPLGLVEKPETETQTRMLEDGDYIILLSDGVLEAMNQGMGESALPEIISRFQTQNPGELANDILSFALHQSKGQIRDDMTVLVTGFWERGR